jgi:hypothetical protein
MIKMKGMPSTSSSDNSNATPLVLETDQTIGSPQILHPILKKIEMDIMFNGLHEEFRQKDGLLILGVSQVHPCLSIFITVIIIFIGTLLICWDMISCKEKLPEWE